MPTQWAVNDIELHCRESWATLLTFFSFPPGAGHFSFRPGRKDLKKATTVKLKDKNMTSWHPLILSPRLPPLLRHHRISSPLFFHTLLIISVALSLFHRGIRAPRRRWDVKSSEAGRRAFGQSQLRNLSRFPTVHDWPLCPAAQWPVSTLRGRISHVGNLNIKTKSHCPQI